MNIFANKKIWKKVAIVIGIIALIGIVFPKQSSASVGGILMTGITDLFVGIADGIQTLIHKIIAKQDVAIYFIAQGSAWFKILVGIALAALLVATGILSAGLVWSAVGLAIVLTVVGLGEVTFNTVKSITLGMLQDDTIALPVISLDPFEIFQSKEGLFSVNFFEKEVKENELTQEKSDFVTLNQNISDWYATLRLIAIVGMMSVLVYMGIRILLSSTAESAAKYKKMMWDWVVATFLIFTMQYIMVFANFLVDSLVDTISSIDIDSTQVHNKREGTTIHDGIEGYIIGATIDTKGKTTDVDTDTTDLVKQAYKQLVNDGQENGSGQYESNFYQDASLSTPASTEGDAKVLFWPAKNFTTQARMNAQIIKTQEGTDEPGFIGFGLIYVVLTIYTIMFIFVYTKRYIYMVFLTLISPLVALTYPIDKVKDGSAQAFNFWFREYVYNLLLRPLHMILYMLLIGSAMRFAADNPLYVVVCLGFMLPAEKLLKAMFGFKGQTPGAMPGLAAGALMMTAARNIFNGNKSSGGSSGSGKDSSNKDNTTPITRTRPGDYFEAPDGSDESNETPELNEEGQAWQNWIDDNTEESEGSTAENSGSSSSSRRTGGTSNSGGSSGSNSSARTRIPTGTNSSDSTSDSGNTRTIKPPRFVREYGGDALKFAGKKLQEGAKSVGKGVVGLGFGTLGATVGGIAGIVSGDPSKAFENMAALGAAGYTIGSRNAEDISETISSLPSRGLDYLKDSYYNKNPEKYDQKVNEEISKNIRHDKEKMGYLRRNIDKEDFKDFVKEGGGLDTYINMGHTDLKDIVAMEEYRKSHNLKGEEGRKRAAGVHKSYTDYFEGLQGKDRDKFIAKVKREMKGKNPSWTDAQINSSFKNTEDLLNEYHKIRKEVRSV